MQFWGELRLELLSGVDLMLCGCLGPMLERSINEGTCKVRFLAKVKHGFPTEGSIHTLPFMSTGLSKSWVSHFESFPWMELMATNAHA